MTKNGVCTIFGAIGGLIATACGGWDNSLSTLVFFMAVDYVMGLAVAGIFKKSKKTKTGSLQSWVGWIGLCKKVCTLGMVFVAHRLDMTIGTNYIRDAVCIGFVANEAISITENAGLMGVPIPKVITKAIEVLKDKGSSNS